MNVNMKPLAGLTLKMERRRAQQSARLPGQGPITARTYDVAVRYVKETRNRGKRQPGLPGEGKAFSLRKPERARPRQHHANLSAFHIDFGKSPVEHEKAKAEREVRVGDRVRTERRAGELGLNTKSALRARRGGLIGR
jgi:hypothetical protein